MENVKIWIDGVQKEVFGLFYIFNSKYYFIYTEKELDENGYVVLYMTTVGKETKNTENGAIETGAMIAMEISSPEEQQQAQTSISYIVEDKKNNTKNPQIQYLSMSMLSELKIISKKRFRLLKSIMEENFKLTFDSTINTNNNMIEIQPLASSETLNTQQVAQPLAEVIPQPQQTVQPMEQQVKTIVESVQPTEQIVVPAAPVQPTQPVNNVEENIIIDYRSKYFEEQEKNKELQVQIDELNHKLEEIKKVIN